MGWKWWNSVCILPILFFLSFRSFQSSSSTWQVLAFSTNAPLPQNSVLDNRRNFLSNSVASRRIFKTTKNDAFYHRVHHHQTTASSLNAASTERSCIELTDPETGCQVVLVGCFHGSPSSAQDVQRELEQSDGADAIVLELCASRFAGLRKSTSYNAFQLLNEQQQQQPKQPPAVKPPGVIRFFQNVGNTIQTQGLSTGVASGLLGGVSGLQTALSGFTPGLEFSTALDYSLLQQQQQQQQQPACDIILADQLVDETVEKVGKLPRVIRSMLHEIMVSGGNNSGDNGFKEFQWVKMAKALRTALVGDPTLRPTNQVNVGQVMTRNVAVIQELSRLMVPPVLLTQLTLTIFNDILLPAIPIEPALAETSAAQVSSMPSSFLWDPTTLSLNFNSLDPVALVMDALPHVIVLTIMLSISYALLAVPVAQVILYERDDQLTDGIRSACRLAASKHQGSRGSDESGSPGRVVAVLGLLHINGVAQRLLATEQSSEPAEAE